MGEQVHLGLAVTYGVDVVTVVCLDVPPAGGVVVGAVAWDAAGAGAEDTVLQALLGAYGFPLDLRYFSAKSTDGVFVQLISSTAQSGTSCASQQ